MGFIPMAWTGAKSDVDGLLSRSIVSAETETLTGDFGARSIYREVMTDGPFIAEAAALIGDPARANMLAALMGGQALTATELGLAASVAASTASGHLAKLLEGGLISVTAAGRHRYYSLASPAVAELLEKLMVLSLDGPPRHRPKSRCDAEMSHARTCYDHLAGKLGVAISDSLLARRHILLDGDGGALTDEGVAFLRQLGADPQPPKQSRRAFLRPCLDWSERRWHVGGSVGAALARRCFEAGWLERRNGSRALTITPLGTTGFERWFGVQIQELV